MGKRPPARYTMEQRFAEFTPIICRLLARSGAGRGVRPLTDAEIARRAGLHTFQVMSIACHPCWDSVTVTRALAYIKGCGIILEDGKSMHNHSSYIKRYGARWAYLRRTKEWESRWVPLIEIQREYYEKKADRT